MSHECDSLNTEVGVGVVNLLDIEIDKQVYSDITICVKNVSVTNTGIGAYECHGYRGYDHGHDCIDDFEYESILIEDEEVTGELFKKIEADQKITDRVFDLLNNLL